MLGSSRQLIWLLALAWLIACSEQPAGSFPPFPSVKTPIPEKKAVDQKTGAQVEGSRHAESSLELLKGSRRQRFETPGRVRWQVKLDEPINYIRWTSLLGFMVSSGPKVYNITSQGENRWSHIAGKGHRLFDVSGQEILWSPAFSRVTQLLRWGRRGFTRKWNADLVDDGRGGFFLVDAANVAAMGPDGEDRWRVALDGVRRLEGPFTCNEGVVFQGVKGMEGVAVAISQRGAILGETMLERGSVVKGAAADCSPLVWNGTSIELLDSRTIARWRKVISVEPIVHRLEGGFLLATSTPEMPVQLLALSDGGSLMWRTELAVKGRLTNMNVAEEAGFSIPAVGLCMDVSSPCARPSGDRGPFNTLLSQTGQGKFRVLIRHIKGHLNFVQYPGGGVVTASSAEDNTCEVVRRNGAGDIVWSVTVPGRLSAGPYIGPWGAVYLGTCSFWECGPPYRFFSITGMEPQKEEE